METEPKRGVDEILNEVLQTVRSFEQKFQNFEKPYYSQNDIATLFKKWVEERVSNPDSVNRAIPVDIVHSYIDQIHDPAEKLKLLEYLKKRLMVNTKRKDD